MANGVILRGEVYWVSVDDSVGAEIQTGRPALVISGDKSNEKEETVIVAYITSGGYPSPFNVSIQTVDGPRRVLCRQLRTIDKQRLTRFAYKLTAPEMIRVNGALASAQCLPLAIPAQPKQTPEVDQEKVVLQAERDAYKRLYETVLEQFIDVKLNYDLLTRMETRVKTEEQTERVEQVEETASVEDVISEEEIFEEPETEVVVVTESEPEPEVEFIPEVVNVNTASAQEIASKTGLPLKDAYAITGYRNKNGLFVELVELLEVSRISKPKFEKFKEWFTLEESVEELEEELPVEKPKVSESVKKVNVNKANIYELMEAGFGKSEAGRIQRWVKKYGPFKSLDDLTKVDGVTGKVLRKFRDGLEV